MLFALGVLLGLLVAAAIAYGAFQIHVNSRRATSPRPAPPPTPRPALRAVTGKAPRPFPTQVGRLDYETRNGAKYKFSVETLSNGNYRAYIESQPSYNSRADDSWTTHRLEHGGRQYVCWTKPLKTPEAAWRVAAKWADCTSRYIRTGKKF